MLPACSERWPVSIAAVLVLRVNCYLLSTALIFTTFHASFSADFVFLFAKSSVAPVVGINYYSCIMQLKMLRVFHADSDSHVGQVAWEGKKGRGGTDA